MQIKEALVDPYGWAERRVHGNNLGLFIYGKQAISVFRKERTIYGNPRTCIKLVAGFPLFGLPRGEFQGVESNEGRTLGVTHIPFTGFRHDPELFAKAIKVMLERNIYDGVVLEHNGLTERQVAHHTIEHFGDSIKSQLILDKVEVANQEVAVLAYGFSRKRDPKFFQFE